MKGFSLSASCGRTFYFAENTGSLSSPRVCCSSPSFSTCHHWRVTWALSVWWALLCIIFWQAGLYRETNSFTFAPPPCSTAVICCSRLKSNCCMLCSVQSDISGYYTQLTAVGNWKYIIWVLNTFGMPFCLSVIIDWGLQMSNQGLYGHVSGTRDLPQTFAVTCERICQHYKTSLIKVLLWVIASSELF